jgi:hypothetical protein
MIPATRPHDSKSVNGRENGLALDEMLLDFVDEDAPGGATLAANTGLTRRRRGHQVRMQVYLTSASS